jgi:hypothetical protein
MRVDCIKPRFSEHNVSATHRQNMQLQHVTVRTDAYGHTINNMHTFMHMAVSQLNWQRGGQNTHTQTETVHQ